MQVMSDAEAFGWRFCTVIFGLILLVLIIHGVKNSTVDEIPNVEYDTITIHDTVTIHDTINHYYPIKSESTESDGSQDTGIIY